MIEGLEGISWPRDRKGIIGMYQTIPRELGNWEGWREGYLRTL
jgi:hypothetical protein